MSGNGNKKGNFVLQALSCQTKPFVLSAFISGNTVFRASDTGQWRKERELVSDGKGNSTGVWGSAEDWRAVWGYYQRNEYGIR